MGKNKENEDNKTEIPNVVQTEDSPQGQNGPIHDEQAENAMKSALLAAITTKQARVSDITPAERSNFYNGIRGFVKAYADELIKLPNHKSDDPLGIQEKLMWMLGSISPQGKQQKMAREANKSLNELTSMLKKVPQA